MSYTAGASLLSLMLTYQKVFILMAGVVPFPSFFSSSFFLHTKPKQVFIIQRQLLLRRGSVKCLTSCHLRFWWSYPFCFRVSCLGVEKLDWWALPERNIFWTVSEADDTLLYSLVKFSKSNSIILSKFHQKGNLKAYFRWIFRDTRNHTTSAKIRCICCWQTIVFL